MADSQPRFAVIQFPGVNCEYESVRALEAAGAEAAVLRWNVDPARLGDYDGFLLPGGFSYQDRVRAGAVAAKDRILDALADAAAAGKPILGICNGAQVLVEGGLIPGLAEGRLELALAPNRMRGRTGYFSEWSHLAVCDNGPAWTAPLGGRVLPIPFAHGEGRFTTRDPDLMAELEGRGQIVLRYSRPDGSEAAGWPENPNGSASDAAGISNAAGNVVAMMPHPERAAWLGQVPEMLVGGWGAKRREAMGDWEALRGPGPGHDLFTCLVVAAAKRGEAWRAH